MKFSKFARQVEQMRILLESHSIDPDVMIDGEGYREFKQLKLAGGGIGNPVRVVVEGEKP